MIASERNIVNTATVHLTMCIPCCHLPPLNHLIHHYLRPAAPRSSAHCLHPINLYEAMLSRAASQESDPYPIETR